MKNAKLLLVFILLVAGLSGLFAANATIAFKDATTATYNLVNPEYQALNGGANYPLGAGNTTNRWRVFAYLSTDAVIDPIGTDGLPTGNDTFLTNLNMNFGPTSGLNISGAVVPEATWMGSNTWIYLRFFNAIDQTAATKHMSFTVAYGPIAAGGLINVNILPTYGWPAPAWVPINPLPADTYQLTVNANVPGMIATGGSAAIGQATPYVSPALDSPATLVGTYSMAPVAGGTWMPASIEVVAGDFVVGGKSGKVLLSKTIAFTWTPDPDIYNYVLNIAGPVGYSVTGPGGTMGFPAIFNAPDTDMDNELLGTYAPVEAAPAGFHWEPASIDVTAGMFQAQKAGAVQGTRSNSSKATYNYVASISFALVPDPVVSDIVIDINGLVSGTATVVVGGVTPPELVGPDTGIPAVQYLISATGVQDVEIMNPGWAVDWYCWIKVGATLYAGGNPIPAATPSWIFTGIDFGAKGDAVLIYNDNATLPVELSSFTATLTATYFVKLTWVSQSETGLLGYRVYRNTSNDQANAVMITPSMVPATNTSTTQTYSITDNEVSIGNTYWYWLESVDYGTSQFHGPVSVIVEGEVPPVIPTATTMRNAYPNPFKVDGRTTIVVDVKANDAGSVTIYNILGQAVKTYPVIPGTNNITWNGRDSRGNVCGSGIYFYKLSTPSTNQTKKMVIVK